MHSDLAFLVESARVVSLIESILRSRGVDEAAEDEGSFANGEFMSRFGPRDDWHIIARLVTALELPDGAEPRDEAELQAMLARSKVGIDVSLALWFDDNTIVGVTYDCDKLEWYRFFGRFDQSRSVPIEAVQMAQIIGCDPHPVGEESEGERITQEGAFAIIGKIADRYVQRVAERVELAKEKAAVQAEVDAEMRKKMN